jgi:hypothetical protein
MPKKVRSQPLALESMDWLWLQSKKEIFLSCYAFKSNKEAGKITTLQIMFDPGDRI